MNDLHDNADELLDHAAAALRDASIPAGPSRLLAAETVGALRAAERHLAWRYRIPIRVARVAAVVALCAGAVLITVAVMQRHQTVLVEGAQPVPPPAPHRQPVPAPTLPQPQVAVNPGPAILASPEPPEQQPEGPPQSLDAEARPVALASDVSIVGQVLYEGPPPVPRPVYLRNCPECGRLQHGPLYDESLVLNENGTLRNVVVSISGGLPPHDKFPVPDDPVVLDQKNCTYRPHVVAAMIGQSVEVRNSDPLMHNVHAISADTTAFNFGQPAPGVKKLEPFQRVETFKVKCDIHPWMTAWVRVFDHPFFAVTGEDGMFHIHGLPPGSYRIKAWHEQLGVQEQEVTVAPGEPATVTFTYRPSR